MVNLIFDCRVSVKEGCAFDDYPDHKTIDEHRGDDSYAHSIPMLIWALRVRRLGWLVEE